ncbi:calcium-binding protein [Leptolyngbya sp. FACHB-541]|uniref:calcium-binding protein n=1 Tax=Leptolyngbya sp. FACHB-541 TaxID=2692810 RepID=UPI0016839347|nr:calcium-binding protein [Leptolyngbya sp. FACHB-541]MBD1998808.1 calcium-binding protein [Leptolyngbya sp. FACHB-541]
MTEPIYGDDNSNQQLYGDLSGEPENDTIYGLGGNDIIFGLGGDDIIYGDDGQDLISGGDGNDWIDAGSGSNQTIYGGNGNDTILGDGSAKFMQGGAGDDLYYVNHQNDYVGEELNEGVDVVRASISYTLTDYVEKLVLEGNAANGTGNAWDNELYGNAADNLLSGGDGNDVLRGGGGNDVLRGDNGDDHLIGESGSNQLLGGSGNDVYYVENATTTVFEVASGGSDAVRSTVSFTLSAEVEALALDGTAAINGTGNNLANIIYGNAANNSISGGGGNDYLAGLGGNDTLTGGSGQDSFLISAPRQGIDTIKDFRVVDDSFYIDRAGFGAGLAAGVITADQFRLGSSAQDSSDRFIYNKGTGAVFFDADGIGGGAQVQIARVSTGLAMTNKDFFVVG